jgi:hypothetical protein
VNGYLSVPPRTIHPHKEQTPCPSKAHPSAILGREAGDRGGRLTMADLLKENKRLTVDLSGLKI